MDGLPSYLEPFADLYKRDPRAAMLAWFAQTRCGLQVHYGLYSLLGRREDVQYRDRIPVLRYERLKRHFSAEAFDAEAIADLACEMGASYINFVTRHRDGFCLWETSQTDFHSVNSPANRDLVAEIAAACRTRGLGLFLFYEHGVDWRHPHGPAPWQFGDPLVRPAYDPSEVWYATRRTQDFSKYLRHVRMQIVELLSDYGPLAGLWFDGASVLHSGDPSCFRLNELYETIRALQPQCLIAYNWGVTGTEDFYAREEMQVRRLSAVGGKPLEVRFSLQTDGWGYVRGARHLRADELMERIAWAGAQGANVLLNIGLRGDGSIHPLDEETLREIGRRVRVQGWPIDDTRRGVRYRRT